MSGFRQFDAPVCVIVTYDRVLDGSDDSPLDCGAVTTACQRCLVAGLGLLDQQPGHHALNGAARACRHRRSGDHALGWPDETFPPNAVISERKSVAEASVFVGFDDYHTSFARRH